MTDEARGRGRPSKYEPRFCEELIEFMGRGYSLTAFAGEIGVARSTINEWMAEHPEFSEATRVGQAKRTRALETTLLAGESGPKVTGHIFALKNADPEGWKDKVQAEHSGPDGDAIRTELTVKFV
jgi:transposase